MLRLFLSFLVVSTAPAAAQPIASPPATFDDHVHLHDGDRSRAAYEAQVRTAGIRLAGYGAMWFGGPNQAAAGNPTDIARRNDELLALAAQHPQLRPIVTVHPYDGAAALAELTRVAGRGARMLKIHPHTQGFDPADPRVLATVRHAGKLGMTVLVDNASIIPGDVQKLFNLALAAAETRFIFAHLGGLDFRFWNVLKLARIADGLMADNFFFDISATVTLVADSPLVEEFVWTIRNVGVDRVMLGSDYPQFSLGQNLAALDRLPLTADEKAQIRERTAAAVFGR